MAWMVDTFSTTSGWLRSESVDTPDEAESLAATRRQEYENLDFIVRSSAEPRMTRNEYLNTYHRG